MSIPVSELMSRFEFDHENTWKNYFEIAVLPSLMFYKDDDVYVYYSLVFHFLNIKVALTYRKNK
jgi:hypothetical protein